jgi:Protein of unknown function (DUF3800)
MLQAMIDESDSQQIEPRVFVMGGYIASVKQWAKLTNEWHAELNSTPHLDYFSFRAAFSPSGAPRARAYGGSEKQRDIRVAKFREIISRNVTAQIGIGFRVSAFLDAYGRNQRFNPYPYSFIKLTTSMPDCLKQLGLGKQRIDLIFDDQKHEEELIINAWYHARENAKPSYPDVFKKILVNAPGFRSSKEVIALQAADLFVGAVRAANVAVLNGREVDPLWGIEKTIPSVFMAPTDEELLADAEASRTRSEAGRQRPNR